MSLSERQQQCLQGIGVRRWRERTKAQAGAAIPAAIEDPYAGESASSETAVPGSPAIELPFPASDVGQAHIHPQEETDSAGGQPQPAPIGADIELPPLDDWDAIESAIEACNACELSQNCTRKVPGVGNREADLLIVGEGPGHDEDLRGEPFVGRSGQLLDRMLASIGLARDQVYITNIVKCRPPNNRDPKTEEAQQCRVFLDAQIRQLQPKVILSVGRVSAHNLLGSNLPVGKLIRQVHELPGTDIPLKVTYHPAYLLRNPSAKAIVWQDMKLLYRLLQ
jgi:DNA polymerase